MLWWYKWRYLCRTIYSVCNSIDFHIRLLVDLHVYLQPCLEIWSICIGVRLVLLILICNLSAIKSEVHLFDVLFIWLLFYNICPSWMQFSQLKCLLGLVRKNYSLGIMKLINDRRISTISIFQWMPMRKMYFPEPFNSRFSHLQLKEIDEGKQIDLLKAFLPMTKSWPAIL